MVGTRSEADAGFLLSCQTSPLTQPPRLGDTVAIYRLPLIRRPLIEGRATILEVLDPARDLYRVRFVGESVPRERFVHPGAWQADPEAMLRALLAHWRISRSSEVRMGLLTADAFPHPGEA